MIVPVDAAEGADQLHRVRRRERSRPVPDPGERAGRGRLGERRRPARARAATGNVSPLRARARVLAGQPLGRRRRRQLEPERRTRCGRWAGRRPTRPGCRSCPGLVRYDEVAAGHIDHAVRFTVPNTQKGYIFPATHYASSSTNATLPPMGLRLRLKASFSLARVPRAVARDPEGAEDVRDDRRRQRLVVVHHRRGRQALERRRPEPAEVACRARAFEAVDTGAIHH